MTSLLSDREIAALTPAELDPHRTPVPTQAVSSDEFWPAPQTREQAQVEARLLAMGDELGKHQGLSRRRFFQTASGMAAAFVAMNQVYGGLFDVTSAEAQVPEQAASRAAGLSDQFIMDMHTHFLRDDTRLTGFVAMRESVGRSGWNADLAGKPQTIEDLKFANYRKELFFDSDTKIGLISSAPSEIPQDWFLTNEQMAQARTRINGEAGARRLFTHGIFTPGRPGWLDELDASLALKPESMKGYTVGDNTHKDLSKYPWRMDDEKTTYLGYERMVKAGIRNVCVHKGLFSPSVEQQFPHLVAYADVRDVGKAAKDWPQLNFIIYHSAYRSNNPAAALAEFERTGRLEWVSDLAEVPEKFGVNNVYGDLGQVFASTLVAQPRVCAAIMGILLKGLGHERVVWGTDALWTGSPQWQIEGLRRLEIPDDMQKKHGFAPLGGPTGAVKTAIFGDNNARLYNVDKAALGASIRADKYTQQKRAYLEQGPDPSNLRYGYINRG